MTALAVAAGTWSVGADTRARFTARGFGVHRVTGTIAVTTGQLVTGADGRPVGLTGTLDPASVDTGHPRRDRDLRGRRFLDVAAHPTMTVRAERFAPTGSGWRVAAVLRVHGTDVALPVDGELVAAGDGLRVVARSQLDLRAAGIRVPGFMVRRLVVLELDATLVRAG